MNSMLYGNYLAELEAESILVIREVLFNFNNPCLLFSGGKDSTVLIHLARKAFPEVDGIFPIPVLHIDTGHNFQEVLDFRDELVARYGLRLWVGDVVEAIASGRARETGDVCPSRNAAQSVTLNDCIQKFKLDCLIGGGRRDEEKARAKERFFSIRRHDGGWNPENQRMEFAYLFNTHLQDSHENMRAFPLNNWTERDVWTYILQEKIEIPSLYFSHQRKCVRFSDGSLMAWSPFLRLSDSEKVMDCQVRFRTVGDMTCTGAVESTATSVESILSEILDSPISERGARRDDQFSESAMEDRKREGYF